ncbi:MAG: DUF559 domain-containing protein [bacterium]
MQFRRNDILVENLILSKVLNNNCYKCYIIEVDGLTHYCEKTVIKDKEKDLIKAGFKVLRFSNEDVLNRIDEVTQTIEMVIDRNPSPNPRPYPYPQVLVDTVKREKKEVLIIDN